ncbi:MAG: hypothetical protein ACHQ53_08300 [Polyangiales bacterium]
MTKATRLSSFACAAVLASITACGGRVGQLEQAVDLLDTKLALDDQVVLIDKSAHHALLLKVTGAQPEATPLVVDLPRAPIAVYRRNGANEALILCEGQRASTGEDEAPAVLAALQADGKVRKYQVGNPFDRLEQSDDGQYALLFKSGTAGRLLDNPNEIAIIDLLKDPKSAVTLRTLTSSGDTPQSVVFSPEMTILGQSRRLAVVLSNASVSLIDLANLDRQETTVELSAAGTTSVKPAQVMFNGSGALAEVYLRGDGSSDVFVFTLTARPGGVTDSTGQHNDFRPTIDQLPVNGIPSDMALYGAGADARLLVLSGSSMQAAVVDVSTSQVTSVQLPSPATQVLLFMGESPRDRQSVQRALLYQPGATSVMFLDLPDLADRGSRNVEEVSLDAAISSLVPMVEDNQDQVLVIHPDGGVSVLDLQARTVAPFTTTAKLTDALFDKDRRRLWFAPQGQPYVGLLDLQNGDTPELLLDADVQQIVPLWKGGKVVAMHSGTAGYLTVIDAVTPKRETAKSVRGFLLTGLLTRGL